MVEGAATKAAELARSLRATHRWCSTGTPISRGLDDLHGLLVFLRVPILEEHVWWEAAVAKPLSGRGADEDEGEAGEVAARDVVGASSSPSLEQAVAWAALLRLCDPGRPGGLLWRNSKAWRGPEEVGIPPQHHHVNCLAFSAIEAHFYGRQHTDCVAKARAAIGSRVLRLAAEEADAGSGVARADASTYDRQLTVREEKRVLGPLLRLRQACCHPQVGAGGVRGRTAQRKPRWTSSA